MPNLCPVSQSVGLKDDGSSFLIPLNGAAHLFGESAARRETVCWPMTCETTLNLAFAMLYSFTERSVDGCGSFQFKFVPWNCTVLEHGVSTVGNSKCGTVLAKGHYSPGTYRCSFPQALSSSADTGLPEICEAYSSKVQALLWHVAAAKNPCTITVGRFVGGPPNRKRTRLNAASSEFGERVEGSI